jgi:hypothetical protein
VSALVVSVVSIFGLGFVCGMAFLSWLDRLGDRHG